MKIYVDIPLHTEISKRQAKWLENLRWDLVICEKTKVVNKSIHHFEIKRDRKKNRWWNEKTSTAEWNSATWSRRLSLIKRKQLTVAILSGCHMKRTKTSSGIIIKQLNRIKFYWLKSRWLLKWSIKITRTY